MILSDEIFEDQDQPKDASKTTAAPNQNPASTVPAGHNEELAKQRDYQQDQSNNKTSDDASAHRNVGANGYTQRNDQKDQLENLHIGGDESHPQGGSNHATAGEQAQGPGFVEEGSVDMGDGIRSQDQEFGEKAPSGPLKKPQDETSN
ncbi:MAG: hypothetical protein ACRYFX_14765 [Janthinobacterium lividum]